MVTVRHSIAVIVCLMYVPHITSMFLKRSGLQNRVSTETQDSNLVLHSNIIFNGDQLQPETLVPIYGSVVLNCEVSGIPTPTIHWLKDGERITQKSSRRANDDVTYEDQIGAEGKQSLMLSVTHSRLYLDCLSADAEGQYTCVAENGMIKKSQSTFVNVVRPDKTLFSEIHECQEKRSNKGHPARIYMWTVSRLEFENSKVQLFCRAEGNPKPNIVWYDRDNVPIENNENYRVASNGDLIIRDVTWSENMGLYTCTADNGFGSDTTQTFLYPTQRGDGFPL